MVEIKPLFPIEIIKGRRIYKHRLTVKYNPALKHKLDYLNIL